MSQRKALVIGVDQYSEHPLAGCVNDANLVATTLRSPSCNYDALTILNSEATRSTVREYIHWLLTDAESSIFYFAGHGQRTSVGTYLLTHDTEPFDEGIDLAWLATAANSLAAAAQTVVLILDCCHSGDANARSTASITSPISPRDIPQIQGRGRVVLAACGGHQLAGELLVGAQIHGIFTHHFCDALSGYASDVQGTVTVNAAYDYVTSKMVAQPNQLPLMRGDQHGSIALARNIPKRGSWQPGKPKKLTVLEARNQAQNLLSETHRMMTQDASFEDWKLAGYANACRTFLPTLHWFQRRIAAQPELLNDADFLAQNRSCSRFLEQLCSVSGGIKLLNGVVGTRIGSGTFGVVWKIENTKWTEPVCFKSFHPHDLSDREKLSRFERGYDAMHKLSHPNVVKVFEYSEAPVGFYMQYIEGSNLRDYNPGATCEPEEVIDLLIGVVETLKHAHGRDVIHRDVKPENILVRFDPDSGRAASYLTDFDLAWFSSATQLTRDAGFGSHYYAAPEQMDTPSAAIAHAPTVDIYSFGQLCFFAVCGRDPHAFDPKANAQIFADSLGQRWRDADASRVLLEIYDLCTKRKPLERLQDFRDVSDRLARARAFLSNIDEEYNLHRLLTQIEFNLSGVVRRESISAGGASFRSRSGRTEMTITVLADGGRTCTLEIAFRPNEMIREGKSSVQARAVVNQRIDNMLLEFAHDHSAERRGAKSGAYEISIRIQRLATSMVGVLRCREIATRTIDILERA